MPLLDADSYRRTFDPNKMERVIGDNPPPFDFWSYFEQIPKADFCGYDCSDGKIEWVWRGASGLHEHVLINTKHDKDVFMVLVLGLTEKIVIGHHLLDLKGEYGLRD